MLIAKMLVFFSGTDFALSSSKKALEFCKEHGVPVMLKAAYGGGECIINMIHLFRISNCAFSERKKNVRFYGKKNKQTTFP